MRALRFDPDGTLAVILLDPAHTLRSLQAGVGGYIEHIAAVSGDAEGTEISLYGDEEARCKGLPISCLVECEDPGMGIDICGPVVIAGADVEGETRGLTDLEIASIRVLLRPGLVAVIQLPGLAASVPALR